MVALFFSACGKDSEDIHVVSFDDPKPVAMQAHALQGDSILWSNGIVVTDSLLINANSQMDTVFNVYRLSDFSYLGSCGVKGEGPDDISFFNNRSWGLFGTGLYYTDINKCNLAEIRFEGGKPVFSVTDRIRILRPGALNGMAVSPDTSLVYFSSMCQGNEFFRTDKHDVAHPIPIGEYPAYISGNIPAERIWMVYSKRLVSHPKENKYAALYDNLPLLRVFDDQGRAVFESILTDWEESRYMPEFSEKASKINYYRYMQACCDEYYVYGLYAGYTVDELMQIEKGTMDGHFSIHVWTWDGRPVVDLRPDRLLTNITVRDGILYGVNTFVSDTVYTYNLDLWQ